MRELLIATANKGKVEEIKELLKDFAFKIVSLDDVGITKDVEESGSTFEGNAIIKAMTYGKSGGMFTLSEDSGLEIDALDGQPGVFTKRYAEGTDDNGHAKILAAMAGVAADERGAQFCSVIALYDPQNDKVRICEGIARGSITFEAKGKNGFGQDPIFRYDENGQVGGEMTTEEKNAVSHRGKSLAKAKEILLKEFV